MSAPLVIVDRLVKQFGDGDTAVTVLKGLDLTLEVGEFVALLGPSGSGKSTLLSILGTLMRPTEGRLTMLGEPLVDADDVQLAHWSRNYFAPDDAHSDRVSSGVEVPVKAVRRSIGHRKRANEIHE